MTQNNQDSKALALVQTMDETALTNILIKDSTLKLDLNYMKIMKEKHSKLPKEQFIDFFKNEDNIRDYYSTFVKDPESFDFYLNIMAGKMI